MQSFHEYLYGNKFTVYSDNNPLAYVLTMAKLNTASHRCVASFALHNFKVCYKLEKSNMEADSLS